MRLLERMRGGDPFEQVIAFGDSGSGLGGFCVFHETTRGPATGGIRLFPYRSEDEALGDGLRLARAMTFKAAAADLPVGGGKIVLMDVPGLVRDEALRAVGRFVQGLAGRFLAGRDVGVDLEGGALVRSETRFMVDESEEGVGDLNRATALGVEAGARAALELRLERSEWKNVRVAIQGAGGVGSWLARLLGSAGAELWVADTHPAALERLRSFVSFHEVHPAKVLDVDAEVFAPCAIGGAVDETAASRLKARIVAGSANNVLASSAAGRALFAAGIAYAPDFLVNAGALIQGVRFLTTGERSSPEAFADIGRRTAALLVRSRELSRPPESLLEEEIATRLDRARRGFRSWYLPPSS